MSGVTELLAGISPSLAPVGLGVGVATQVLGGLAAAEQSKTQAKYYAANADIAKQQAANQAAQEKDKYRRLAASQRASFGASGIEVNEGSPLDVLADTDAEGAVSAMQLLYGGQLEAANWRQRARTARNSANMSMFETVLGGVDNLAAGYARLNKKSGASSPLLKS